ncbi:unnamed protein product [Trichobilharzia szidati]|nr:unnamed protein product [Trichobilharzia szidati]
MCEIAQLNALLKITAAKVDIEDEFLGHYINKIIKIITSSDLNKPVTEELTLSIKCLTNICSTSQGIRLLTEVLSDEKSREEFTNVLSLIALNSSRNGSDLGSLTVNSISNMTRDPLLLNYFNKHFDKQHIISIMESDFTVQQFLPIILNLTTEDSSRHVISSTLLPRLIDLFPQLTSVSDKVLISGIIKNCSFEDDLHCKLLDKSVAFLDKWLIPLCGPEDCINKEDLAVLPKSVQTVSGNPNIPRLFSADLCLTICQTFLQFCSTSHGRTILRSNGVYFILRELHKYVSMVEGQVSSSESGEKNLIKELLFYIEQVVDQLICEENERDQNYTESSLREIPVDTMTSEKLERAKQDYLECK